jgi:hypothetical protein
LFIEPGDRSSVTRLIKALEYHAVDGCGFVNGGNYVRWWRLDSHRDIPPTDEIRSSVEILWEITENVSENRSYQNKVIAIVNGYASDGYQKSLRQTEPCIYGALGLRFAKREINDRLGMKATMDHPLWNEYLISKARELAAGETSRKKTTPPRKSS